MHTAFTEHAGIEVPLICGAMYPCSNLELVAAASAAGGIGIVQPISLIYAHKTDLREGLRAIRAITDRPIGFNAIVEQSSKVYEDRMRRWVDIALEEGVRFFVTALGNLPHDSPVGLLPSIASDHEKSSPSPHPVEFVEKARNRIGNEIALGNA